MNILIVAGNYAEYANYKRHKLNLALMNDDAGLGMEIQAYRYVDSADKIRGMRDVTGVFIGSWRSRKDILEIVAQLRFLMSQRNHALEKVWNELCSKATALQVNEAVSAPSVRRAADELAAEIDRHVLEKLMQQTHTTKSTPLIDPSIFNEISTIQNCQT
jgi:hypothetical protein